MSAPTEDFVIRIEPCISEGILVKNYFDATTEARNISLKREVKEEDLVDRKSDLFCGILAHLLTDNAEKKTAHNSSSLLNENQDSVSNVSKKNYERKDCHKKFRNICHSKIHCGKKIYCKCEGCDQKFMCNSNLKRHMVLHTGEKNFKCSLCRMKFARSGYLKNHLEIHSGEKRYECKLCLEKFRRNDHLSTHMMVHSGKRTCECKLCGKKFTQPQGLRCHMTTHRERASQCKTTSNEFHQSLSDHNTSHPMSSKTKDFVINIEPCPSVVKRCRMSAPIKDFVIKIEPCASEGIRTMDYFDATSEGRSIALKREVKEEDVIDSKADVFRSILTNILSDG